MERGAFADAAVDQIRELRVVSRKHICLSRGEQRRWRIGELAQNRLTANDYDFGIVRDRASRTNDVLKLGTLQIPASALPPLGPPRMGKIVSVVRHSRWAR